MTRLASGAAALAAALLLSHCAVATYDDREIRKAVGTEDGVRLEGEIVGDDFGPGARVPISWSVTNGRTQPIAVADIIAESSYDPDSRTITVGVGAEVPGEQFLPRLVVVAPGETKTFTAKAACSFIAPREAQPNAVRIRLNFLSDVKPFERLIGIEQKAVADRSFAEEIFPLWVERTEAVFTNAVPVRWGAPAAERISAARHR